MSVRIRLGAIRRRVLSSVYCRTAPWADRGPVVSFSFDDFPRTAYSTGGAILEEFGARGTYYASAELMNAVNELGEHFSFDDLHALVEKGHELGSHTFSHISCRAVSSSAFRADVEKGRNALKELVGMEMENFSYPFGHVSLNSKRFVAPEFASARSIFPGLNGPNLDLNLLRANALYGGLERARRASDLIDENVRRTGWLIFYTHDVRSAPSPFGCTAELLKAAVSSAVRSGSRILTVNEVLMELGLQSGKPKGLSFQTRHPETSAAKSESQARDFAGGTRCR
jgi:peptidoglycan/xylan/chitin deacetylase (PgdA/CDA1 family)